MFTSEWDRNSEKTYEVSFGDKAHGDIKEFDPAETPNHDICRHHRAACSPCVHLRNEEARIHERQLPANRRAGWGSLIVVVACLAVALDCT